MRAVVQKVTQAAVDIVHSDNISHRKSEITEGLLVLVGITHTDTDKDAAYLADKIAHMRIFPDSDGKMNLSVQDINGSVMLVSQFTLFGDARNGRRPSFTQSAKPEFAEPLYHHLAKLLTEYGLQVATGQFQTHMHITLVNDGPVTLLLDSQKTF